MKKKNKNKKKSHIVSSDTNIVGKPANNSHPEFNIESINKYSAEKKLELLQNVFIHLDKETIQKNLEMNGNDISKTIDALHDLGTFDDLKPFTPITDKTSATGNGVIVKGKTRQEVMDFKSKNNNDPKETEKHGEKETKKPISKSEEKANKQIIDNDDDKLKFFEPNDLLNEKKISELEREPRVDENKEEAIPTDISVTLTLSTKAKTVTVDYKVDGKTTSKDWIGIFVHNRQFGNKYTHFFYTSGAIEGSYTFNSLVDGFYDVRYFKGRYNMIKKSDPICVGPEIKIDVKQTGSELLISTSQTTNEHDWIGVFESGTCSNKRYIYFKFCDGSGEMAMAIPSRDECKSLDIRYFKEDSRISGTWVYSGVISNFVIEDKDYLDIKTERTVDINNPQLWNISVHLCFNSKKNYPQNWIGLYLPDTPIRDYFCYALCPFKEGIIHFDTEVPKGQYEIRFYTVSGTILGVKTFECTKKVSFLIV